MSVSSNGSVRAPDGYGTHPDHPHWGATNTALLYMAYKDLGTSGEMSGTDRPDPRTISNILAAQDYTTENTAGASDFLWIWGQFLDHDLSLTQAGNTVEAHIPVPSGDPFFDPDNTGTAHIEFMRVDAQGDDYVNEITAYIDASMIYGSTQETLDMIRAGGGKLRVTQDDHLVPAPGGFVTGDIRAAENLALSSMHTIFTREHNRIVDELKWSDPDLTHDELFHAARAHVEAKIQAITYNEFLPILIGKDALAPYSGYDKHVDPGIAAEFSTAVFRLGHTLLSSDLKLLDEDGTEHAPLALRDAFFQPHRMTEPDLMEKIMRGAAEQHSEALDNMVVEDVRSFLFGAPGAGGFDLASLNIQRGRDLGIVSYNDLRKAVGLDPAQDFYDITWDDDLAGRLEEAYGHPDHVDAWVGGLAEDRSGDGLLGETFSRVMVDQFTRLRDGDPYWSEGRKPFPGYDPDGLWDTTLSDVLLWNTDIEAIQQDAFAAMNRIAGTERSERLAGTHESDFIHGHDGHDRLLGRGGKDDLQGGHGNDKLFGQNGSDYLDGDRGRDLLKGGNHDDFIFGGRGRDRLFGGNDDDKLYGGHDHDVLKGDRGDDMLYGGKGNDKLIGGPGNDMHEGGAGRDLFMFKTRHEGENVIEDFQMGFDRVKISGTRLNKLEVDEVDGHLELSHGNWSLIFKHLTEEDWYQHRSDFL